MKNPLLEKYNTPYGTVPFSLIKEEYFLPALKEAIIIGKSEIDIIANNSEAPTFDNTIEAMQYAGELVGSISTVFFNLNSAETNDEIQKIAQEFSPLITEYSNDIRLNPLLFERINSVWENKESFDLDDVQLRLLEKSYKGFARNGAKLSDADKDKLREIDTQLSKLSLNFGENVLAETNAYELHLTDESDLDGLPQSAKDAAAMLAKDKEKEGWIINLDFPSVVPFLKYATNRELRKEVSIAFGSRAFKGNEKDNSENVIKIVQLRQKRAELLGYKSHADFVLEERMAKSPETVSVFLNDLLEKAKPAAEKEFTNLSEFAKSIGGPEELQSWDASFYTEKLKKEKFDFDSEELKPYFKLENVIDGVFTIAGKLYDIKFEEINNIDKYHEDVKTYKVLDLNDNLVSVFYADFFPREGKRGGAWMTSYKDQRVVDGVDEPSMNQKSHPQGNDGNLMRTPSDQNIKIGIDERPHVSIVCNFTKPTETEPSLLTFMEVTTLFHEFGHALHGMLSQVKYESLSGTSVYWDFVELPSQVFENWCYEKEALDLFAKHYKTREAIPENLIQKIKDTSNFMEGMQTLRQLNFGLLDMNWHNNSKTDKITNVGEFEFEATKNTSLYPHNPQTCSSVAFSHIFQGGYSSGYYSYKWAEVLDADAFEYFKEKGIFNKEVATLFKENILSKGGSEHPAELYRKFRGKDAKVDALLKRAGLL